MRHPTEGEFPLQLTVHVQLHVATRLLARPAPNDARVDALITPRLHILDDKLSALRHWGECIVSALAKDKIKMCIKFCYSLERLLQLPRPAPNSLPIPLYCNLSYLLSAPDVPSPSEFGQLDSQQTDSAQLCPRQQRL